MIQASLPSKIPLPPRPEPNPDTPTQIPLPDPSPAIEITPLLSSAPSEDIQTLHNLYAAQIATLIWTAEAENHVDVRRPLVLGIALRKSNSSGHELNPEIFGGIMKMVSEVLWGEPTLSKP
ncbi:hypothetical protein DL96DRAFT_1577967 [Flagelloscypha sp. PMI_526]|nr:hypothetical protein DL96DRAFT_1577967 [Flagelloscypha sp. PMI_526]